METHGTDEKEPASKRNAASGFKQIKRISRRRMRAPQIIVLGFLSIILAGALLLMLPVSNRGGLDFTDALFTSVSAVCVTGLTTVDIASGFTIFGQCIIILLMQTGGLGFMAMATLVFLAIRKRITLRERMAIQDSLNQETHQGVIRMTKKIFIGTFIIEGAGFLLLLPFFIINFGAIGAFKALFTAVSAFCNCGLDNLGDTAAGAFSSLSGFGGGEYYGRVVVLLSICFLIVLGGLGFAVITDVIEKKRFRKFRLHTKLALAVTGILLASGVIVYMAAEYNNPDTLGGMSFFDKLLNSFALAVFPRTSGFSAVATDKLTPASTLFSMFLMFIGASPASTGGGIKTTTAAILLIGAWYGFRDGGETTAGGRTITRRAILKSLAVFLFALLLVLLVTMVIMATESGSQVAEGGLYSLENLLFEAVSAFSTTGLSRGVTPLLSAAGKYLIMLLMFCGRLGPLTIGLMFIKSGKPQLLKYPDAYIMIG